MKFRKKPIVIEASQWFKLGDHKEVYLAPFPKGKPCKNCGMERNVHGLIDTLEAEHIVCPGDWIITGIKGEHYPCKPEIFKLTYDESHA